MEADRAQDDDLLALADIEEETFNDVKRASLPYQLRQDIEACDMKWSLFVAALSSYKKDFAARPFPPDFVTHQERNFAELEHVMVRVPPLPSLAHRQKNQEETSDGVTGLLSWLFNPSHSFTLRSLNLSDQWSEIKQLPESHGDMPRPTHLFEVQWSEESEKKWQKMKELGSGKPLFAFHGSALHNFHSILHMGLRQNLNKASLFGEGTYLHSELLVSLLYSPSGKGWDKSILGSQMSVVALCEIVDHPSVMCHHSDKRSGSPSSSAGGRLGNEVPKKYLVVTNDELVRVKYLLVYAKVQRSSSVGGNTLQWFKNHFLTISIIVYVAVLLSVGLFNSRSFQLWLKKISGVR